ncbi:nuclear transport factor 2 family protein [Mycobacterium hubeiense]|uniref:nuclear transport factor 2 family protein n=1 Tax=Mycobacterium hubeiense TaxID=1867256 RepID=UPI000C7EB662|nr:nuclear transport factor 2 family protein [Mycobacterium sp. QGD 101]
MKTLYHLGPSPEHAQYQAIMPEFWKRTKKQEEEAVKRGLPAKGLYDFGRRWFEAWNTQSVDRLRDCMTPDCGFIDSSTFQNQRTGREETLANCAACFEAFPDMGFYPQDGTVRSLPYADYFDGQWRVVIPWRGVARWTGPVRVPATDIVVPPTGKCINFIGVDRYMVTDDWKISHIDTDWDILYIAIQMSPVGVPAPSLPVMRAMTLAARVAMPALRLLGRSGTPDGHRRFSLPFPSITSSSQWDGGADAVAEALSEFRSKSSA